MGHKVHPLGFRLGINKDWQAHWYAKKKNYRDLLLEDLKIRQAILEHYRDAGVSRVEIERGSVDITVAIHTARPGIVIGRGGQRVEETRRLLEALIKKRIHLNIQEIRQPELEANLVARSVADGLERRVSHRRAMKQAMQRALQAGAKGIKIAVAGRLGGGEIARRDKLMSGRVPLGTIRADIDYGFVESRTLMGRIGVKVWVFKGEILPEKHEEAVLSPREVIEEPKGVTAEPGQVS